MLSMLQSIFWDLSAHKKVWCIYQKYWSNRDDLSRAQRYYETGISETVALSQNLLH